MKNQQHQAARELYFNTNLSKTDIAEKLNVTRRSIYQWSIDGDWDKLRQSARHMPAILAEKCYYLIGHIADQLLAESNFEPITPAQVNMLHKLTLTVKNLKRGTTVADNMESFTHLLDRINHKDPELAEKVAPHVNDYITARSHKTEHDFLLDGFDHHGHLITPDNTLENQLDAEEALAIFNERQRETTPSVAVCHSERVEELAKEAHSHTSTTSATPAPAKENAQPSKPVASSTVKPATTPTPTHSHEPIRPVHTPLPTNRTARPHAPAVAVAVAA